jgi:ribosomal protein S18 acetylase RimI-like enzyme
MSLPILSAAQSALPEDLIRFFHRVELHWTRHLAEETVLDAGTAFTNPELPNVYIANRMFDVSLPEIMTPQQALDEVNEHFVKHGTRCWSWAMAPTSDPTRRREMIDHLLSIGYTAGGFDILHLAQQPRAAIQEVGGLTIIPARASYKHYRMLAEEWAAEYQTPDFADAVMLSLDDPHVDALLAMKDGKPAAYVAVQSVGEMGGIQELFVTAPFRGQGIGRTMMSRAMEICARSLFKHVFVGVHADNPAAVALYTRFGFRKVGQFTYYRSPSGAP